MSYAGPKNALMFDLITNGCRIEIFEHEPNRPFLRVWIPGELVGDDRPVFHLFNDFLNSKPVRRSARQAAWTRALKEATAKLSTLLDFKSE